ncbi:NAD(P)-binding protein [Pseudobacteroides cellulosolvens]|uniref:Hydrogenase, Fe-only n=1 Tax=Pseudobacteroides cellulosolvens ATCC 35603 = DSM 2933 TaxID=398512 RepID=A0A0L6JVS1_9FIRM|nr:NAD(P)-binding protein [Pseudobacteroides cellulosolvens]KNY29938.1 hydrogenase, Fe-only [Pseudobacteroides cellulosolvens ATCC 35603 = DSM 2933]
MKTLTNHKRIKVTVNGREIEVYDNLTILQALMQEDIHIPHLCYDIRLERSNGNCGLCVVEVEGRDVKACQTPIKEGMVICTNSPKLENYRKIRLEQLLSDHNADCVAPCVMTCPANIDIQSYLRHVGNGNYEAAIRVIKDNNPFPIVCGRVCPHTCEAACRRNLVDSPVAINYVKRFAADLDMEKGPWIPDVKPSTGKKIAIVGAGPSGLSAAYYSAINGYDVTVFERQPHAGGMMRYGIPEYRLPKATLDKEIDIMKKMGVKIMTGKALGTHIRLEDLNNDFDSVYLAIGSWRATPMHLEGENLEGVWLGIQYLEQVTKGMDIKLGDNVVVIGGGNTAIDCARTALRKGAKSVKLIYRRTREEMPAEPYEVEEALHEGVEMLFLMAPNKIVMNGGKKTLHCMEMQLGEPDRSGRRRPVPVEGSDVLIDADTIIGAIGQSTNTQFLYNDMPVKLNKWGDIEINGHTMQTSEVKIFAGGDCVTGPATVIQAVAAGRHAADAMDSFLTKGYVHEQNADYSCSRGSMEDLPKWEFEEMPKISRAKMPDLAISQRKNNFDEVELGLTEEMAREEARRCLKCGCKERYSCDLRKEAQAHKVEYVNPIHERPFVPIVDDHPFIIRDHNKCISCGRCIAACAEIEGPDVLTYYTKHGRQLVGTKSGLPLQETDCVSCGQCVNACPCGALDYRREKGKVFRAINDSNKVVVGFVAPAVRSIVSSYFGIPYDEASPFMAGILRKMGFDKIFDFSFAADLTIVEETTEFLTRVDKKGVMPQFTSCCPGWVNFVEKRYPQIIPHLSTCKSPQQMMGATVKNHYAKLAGVKKDDLFVVSIVPCLAKKHEAARPEFAPEGIRDVDAVLTSSEMLEMVELLRIKTSDIVPQEFDDPYKRVTGAGVLFGASGGVAEAALRMAVEKLTGNVLTDHLDFEEIRGFEGLKEATVDANGTNVRVAVISGLHNAEPIVEKIIQGVDVGYDLIEVMACPGGCICGAGHPVPEKIDAMEKRQQVLVNIDKTAEYRKSQENPDILRLYNEFYGEANSHLAHELLHTSYTPKVGDNACNTVRKKANSTFVTQEFTICMCDSCASKGSKELYSNMSETIKKLKMDSFINIRTIRLKDTHSGSGIYITLNGQQIDESALGSTFKSSK